MHQGSPLAVRASSRLSVIPRDGVRLSARISLPTGQSPFPCVVFVHGLGSSKDSPRNTVIAEHLLDAGLATLLFDLSGHGESSADPHGDGQAYVNDLAAAFEWARRRPEIAPERIGVAGSSLGAVVALDAVRGNRVRPAALVLRAPPVDEGDLDGIDAPSLVLIGSLDPLLAQVLAAARGRGVTLRVVEGAGHLFEEPGTLEQVLAQTVSWFKERLVASG
jgi:alpha-beta hydrolase superfamily lysophospholipase